jgi:replicative DNA helicase
MRTGRLDDDWSRLIAATSRLAMANIHYCDSSSVSLAEMRTIIRNIERDHGKLSLIAVDYLQLINEGGESQTHSIAKISTGLKKIAKDFDVPMLALSQLNRDLEKRADKRPMMADLRQSGQIEQDADLIIFLYRDEAYNPQGDQGGIMEIIVGKHRNGELGNVRAAYLGEFTRVDNLQPI